MHIWIFLAVATLLRILLASLFPLTADEAYYWLWSKHLALSYVDHPPMVAYINFLTTFGAENLLTLRLGAIIIFLLVSIFIYFLAKEIFNEKVAFWSAVLFQLLPHFLIIWLTMFVEPVVALCWSAALLVFSKIIRSQKKAYWYLLALILGLGYLSKYTMFLFWPCLAIFFLLSPDNRFWLRRKEPYLTLIISFLFFLPVLYWNYQNHWVSFAFHGAKVAGDPWIKNLGPFIADQLIHFTPFLIFTLPFVFYFARKGNDRSKMLFAFSSPILLLFLLLPLKIKVWAHWPAIGYIAAIPLTVNYLIEKEKSLGKFLTWISMFSALILIILFFISPATLLHQRDYSSNYKLPSLLPKGTKVFAKTYASAAILEFYTKRPIYLATGFLKDGYIWGEKQYELWGIPALEKGENTLYYGEDSPVFRKKALANFEKISETPDLKLYLIEDYITNNYKFFKLEGYRGGNSHP